MIPTELLCYYPTNVAIIDDSDSFLAMINDKLDPQQPRQLYNNPAEALQKINNKKSNTELNSIIKNIPIEDVDELSTTDYAINSLINVDLKQLHNEIYNKNRFDRISAILIDYQMAQMNGLEFCRKLSDKTICKIMITSLSDFKLAVDAFNDGIIDKFIIKGTPDFFHEINSCITKAQKDYFKNIYGLDGLLGFMLRGQLQFATKSYYELIEQVANTVNAIEFYLLDKSGSILFLDVEAKPTWLIIRTKSELEELYAIAKDNNAPSRVLDALNNKHEMPILLCEEDYQLPVAKWQMFPVKPFITNQKSYYSIIIDQPFKLLDFTKITSFNQYATNNPQAFLGR